MIRIIILMVFIIVPFNLGAQKIKLTNWEAYTSMYDAVSLDKNNNSVYAATKGGVYFTDIITKETKQFTNVNGLSRIDARFIKYDEDSDKIFVGYNDGVFDIYSSDAWEAIYDIQNAEFVKSNINYILPYENRIYISGGFGLVVFDHEENITIEDVKRLGDFPSGTEVRTIKIFDNKIWVATTSGIAYTDFDNSLANRFDWTNITTQNSSDDSDILDIEWVGDSLYATSGDNIYKWDGGEFLIPVLELPTRDIIGLSIKDNRLVYFKQKNVLLYPNNEELGRTNASINDIIFNQSSDDIFIASSNGIQTMTSDTTSTIELNSPISNGFADIHIAQDGSLWVGTGIVTSKGLMRFKNGLWTYFNSTNIPNFASNSSIKVNELSDGRITSSTYGGGILIFDPELPMQNIQLTKENSPLVGTNSNTDGNFVITGDTYEDEFGNIWIVNWGNIGTGPLFVVQQPSGLFETLTNCGGSSLRTLFKMAVDYNGTKWVGSSSPNVKQFGSENRSGLAYYNEMRTLSDKSDDICGVINVSNSDLISDHQTAVVFDKQGTLWLGTTAGVNRIINPNAVLGNSNPIIVNIRVLSNLNVREIIVDALDNKWVATASGLFVVDADGENVLYNLTTDNSPLPTNDLLSLGYDENSGKVYIGTDKGMYSVQTGAIKPLESFDLKVYPQPYDSKKNKLLTIEGLSENSDLRIVTVSGELVKKIKVNSRTTTWDGTNERGEPTSPGVYLLYAVSSTNESTEVIKIAVVNK